jgi:hypothetical protein
VPWLDWPRVAGFINKTWDPENAPHHSVIGMTGSGKTHLCVNGILKPLCSDDRVLIIDTKHNDRLVAGIGKPVDAIPADNPSRVQGKRRPMDRWFRLVVHDQWDTDRSGRNRVKASDQVLRALDRVYHEGEWVLYCDELQDLGGSRQPNLGLSMNLDEIYRKGRSKHISILAGTQAPRHVPTCFYDQCDFAWIGRLSDEDKQKRLREIGGMPKEYLPSIMQLRKREWLLTAQGGDYILRTKVT